MNLSPWRPRVSGEQPRALVLSTQYRSGPWCVRSLRAGGFEVIGAERLGRTPAQGRSLACPRPIRYPSPAAHPAAFTTWLRGVCADHAIDVILPNSEDAVRVIASRAPDLAGAVVAGPTAPQYQRLCDKAGLAAAAQEAGAAHPTTTIVREPATDPFIPAPPVIVKPAVSGEKLDAVLGTVLATTVRQRDDAIRAIVDSGSPALVQEFIEGTPWVVHGVRTRDGRLMVTAARVATTYPRRVGVSSISRSVPCPPQLLADTQRLLSLVGYVGPFCTNAIERDGIAHTHDVNLRVAASVGLAISAGLDVPNLGARAALGLSVQPDDGRRAVTYLRLDGEVRAFADALRRRPPGGSALTVIREAASALPARPVLDPNPFDPLWAGLTAARAIGKALRAGR